MIYKFRDRVYKPPYSPYYDEYQGHTFAIDHELEEDDTGQHVWLTCVSDPGVLVKGYVDRRDLEVITG